MQSAQSLLGELGTQEESEEELRMLAELWRELKRRLSLAEVASWQWWWEEPPG